jgi:MOSC domain-containing protein YiiM
MFSPGQAEVEKDLGIIGDRYHQGQGTFSRWQRPNRAISLIESEALRSIKEESGIDLTQGLHRRNLVTTGLTLPDLIGGNFRIGTALFHASATCPPCRYLERLLGPGTFEALRYRGGIRAEVIECGLIQPGDAIVPVGERTRLP